MVLKIYSIDTRGNKCKLISDYYIEACMFYQLTPLIFINLMLLFLNHI